MEDDYKWFFVFAMMFMFMSVAADFYMLEATFMESVTTTFAASIATCFITAVWYFVYNYRR